MNNTEDQMLPTELRTLASMLVLQGMLAGRSAWTDPELVDRAVELADALLARLAE